MYRLVVIIIAFVLQMVLEIFFPDSRYRRYSNMFGRRRYNRMYQFFEDDFEDTYQDPNYNTLANRIRAGLRRRKALKKCAKFLTKENYILTLKNLNVILIMDTKNKTISCVDNKIKGRAATVLWSEHPASALQKYDNFFELTFDNICTSFSEDANYSGIIQILKESFEVHETNPIAQKKTPVKTDDDKPIKLTTVKVAKTDINSADETELAKLPGISVIIAKKIIKYRNLHGGFNTKEEFYKEMNIKKHFQEQLEDLINITPCAKKQKKNHDERIIDF